MILDKYAHEMLSFLCARSELSARNLAKEFNEKYKIDESDRKPYNALLYLESINYVNVKFELDNKPYMIETTHLGTTHQERMATEKKEKKRDRISERIWQIAYLLIDAIISFGAGLLTGLIIK